MSYASSYDRAIQLLGRVTLGGFHVNLSESYPPMTALQAFMSSPQSYQMKIRL